MPSQNVIIAYEVEGAALPPGKHVKKGSTDRTVVLSGDEEESIGLSIGSDDTFAVPVGDHADIILEGIGKVLLSGTIAAETNITPDANGDAKALPATADTKFFRSCRTIESGIDGDMVDCRVTNDVITNP